MVTTLTTRPGKQSRYVILANGLAVPASAVPLVGAVPLVSNGATLDMQKAPPATAASMTAAGMPMAALVVQNTTNDFRTVPSVNGASEGVSGNALPPFVPYYQTGTAFDRARSAKVVKVVNAVTVTTEATIWTPTASRKFRLMGGVLAASAAGTLTLKDNTAGTTILAVVLEANKSIALDGLGQGILSAAANNVLTATLSVAGTLTGYVTGTEE